MKKKKLIMPTLYDEYENYVIKYKKEYGDDIVVFYRCGSFFEIYSANDGLIDMKKICDILNIQMSRRNKSIIEVNRSNTLMAGFPMYTLQKFTSLLINNNYTVIIVDQITEAPKPERAVTSIISPGTDLNNINSFENNNLMSIFIQNTLDYKTKKNIIILGISIIDLSTGVSKTVEISSTSIDQYLSLDEAYRIIQIENPKEIILFGDIIDTDNIDIVQYLELAGKCVHNKINSYNKEILKISYQKQLLQKIFPNYGLLSVIEYLDLELYPIAIISFVYLLQFSFQHNDNILNRIQKPIYITNKNNLVLSYNCIKHLNIISNDIRVNSLLSILNRSTTAIGKRLFREWFLNPIIDKDILESRYNSINHMLENKKYEKIQKNLQDVYDIERLLRKIGLKIINPCEYNQIYSTTLALLEIIKENTIDIKINTKINSEDILSLSKYISDNLDLKETLKYNIDNISESFFNKGVNVSIQTDLIESKQLLLKDTLDFFQNLANKLNRDNTILFKVDNNQIDGYHLVITIKRYNDIKKNFTNFTYQYLDHKFEFKDITIKQSGTSYKIYHSSFKNINDNINIISTSLVELIKEKYEEFTLICFEKYSILIQNMIKIIGEIDFFSTCAKNAFQYRYFKPTIQDKKNKTSYILGKNLRHPIIERINTNTEYIPNDICIGVDNIEGILLYGTNMVGKSAYMKSIGISLIMAQCGMFVPCDDFTYYPFNHIFTRIPSGDDVFKGQSTFAVEISELRNILKRADNNSLVIGDEMASGTESISAVAIVASGIIQLHQKNAKFVFATHLHDLVKLEKIKNLEQLKIYHLSVIYDDINKKLIYNRKLQEGQGCTMYGLEVCRALNLSNDFLLIANQFRQELLDINKDIVNIKPSKYNKDHYVDICNICGEKAMEVHHIKHQIDANENGYIGSIHKNNKTNLMNVCEKCHDNIHNGDINVNGYIQTSNGIELDIVHNITDANKDKDKDINEEIIELYRQKQSFIKIKDFLSKKNINLSVYKIKKIINIVNL